ncbi:MAG: adenine deaminase [Mycobacterium leprae]
MAGYVGPVQPDEVQHAIAVAGGRTPGSLLLTGVQVVNVFTGEMLPGPILLAGRLIAGVGDAVQDAAAEAVLDLSGYVVAPGFVDGHVHLESALVEPREYARAVVPRGVTAVVWDPHEWANVVGEFAFTAARQATDGLALDVFFTASSCVAASPLETAGASLSPEALDQLLAGSRVVGLGELMNFPGVIAGGAEELAKAWCAERRGKVIDGHAPLLTGRGLQAYAVAGIGSDHECMVLEEAREKLRLGLMVFIREGSAARNLEALLPLVTRQNRDRFCFVTDDRHPHDLVHEGGVDFAVRKAVNRGMEATIAVQLATLNPARYFGLRRRGAVAPGYMADLAILDPQTLSAHMVFKEGRLVAQDGELLTDVSPPIDPRLLETVKLPVLTPERLSLGGAAPQVRVIGLVPDQIVTRSLLLEPTVREGEMVPDPGRDLAKLVVIERHGRTGGVGVGLLQGLGLRKGAIASTVAHDAHNIIVAGMSDGDILLAARAVAETGGGFAVVDDGRLVARLELPVGGLMSHQPLDTVAAELEQLERAARDLGVHIRRPFMAISFLALSVIPELKLTDQGLVEPASGQLVSLRVE